MLELLLSSQLLAQCRTLKTHASAAQGANRLPKGSTGCKFLTAPVVVGILAVFTWLGAVRTQQWSSRELLFGTDAESYPQSTKTRHQFGNLCAATGRALFQNQHGVNSLLSNHPIHDMGFGVLFLLYWFGLVVWLWAW